MITNLGNQDRSLKSAIDHSLEEPSVATLLGGILGDAQKLVRQEISLVRVEVAAELSKAKNSAEQYSVAIGVAFVAVFLAGMALSSALMALGLMAWASYTIVTALYAGTAYYLMMKRTVTAKDLDFVPRQTLETLKENAQWIRNQN